MHKMWNFSTLQRPTQEEKERRRRYREEQLLRERQHSAMVNDANKIVNRAKTFRHINSPGSHGGGNNSSSSNNDGGLDYNDNEYGMFDSSLLDSLPSQVGSSANFIEALRHRAKSASRLNDHQKSEQRNRFYGDETNFEQRATRTLNRDTRKRESKSAGANPRTFRSRLRFLEGKEELRPKEQFKLEPNSSTTLYNQQNQRFLRWQDQRDQLSSGYSSGGGGRTAQEQEFNSDDTNDTAMDIYAMTTTMQRKKKEKELQARSQEPKQRIDQRGYDILYTVLLYRIFIRRRKSIINDGLQKNKMDCLN